MVRGNSYCKLLYKSFECTNPQCPSRSKIGRGKRYDSYTAKRQVMLERNLEEDLIDDHVYHHFRRDIISDASVQIKSLISLYSWAYDSVFILNVNKHLGTIYKERKLTYENLPNSIKSTVEVDNLAIYKLFKHIRKQMTSHDVQQDVIFQQNQKSFIINLNSS